MTGADLYRLALALETAAATAARADVALTDVLPARADEARAAAVALGNLADRLHDAAQAAFDTEAELCY